VPSVLLQHEPGWQAMAPKKHAPPLYDCTQTEAMESQLPTCTGSMVVQSSA